MGRQQQQQQQGIQMQQHQGPATIVAIPSGANQDVILMREEPAKKGSKLKSFFSRNKKAKVVLSERDAAILKKVKRRAKVLDTGLNLGFAKIGLDPIIGLIPVAGDAITLVMAMNLIRTAQQADIPKELTTKMLFNVAIDFGCGLVPVLGDIVDFLYKGNDRNAKLFEAFLYERAAAQQAAAEAEASSRRNVPVPVPMANPNTNGHTYVNMNGNSRPSTPVNNGHSRPSTPVNNGHSRPSTPVNNGQYPPHQGQGHYAAGPASGSYHGNSNVTASAPPPPQNKGGRFGGWGSQRTAAVS